MSDLTVGSSGFEVVLLQKGLREKLTQDINPDGNFGPGTQAYLTNYQNSISVPATGVYDDTTRAILDPYIASRFVSNNDFITIGSQLGVSPAIIYAFCKVEGQGCGFLPDCRPKILFERHHFYKNLAAISGVDAANAAEAANSNICNEVPGGYSGGVAEWDRISAAIDINETAAFMSASWGLFQIMGENFKMCGFNSVQDFVSAIYLTESNHLKALASFIQAVPALHTAMRNSDFDGMAAHYNGAGYKNLGAPTYDVRLQQASQEYTS